MQLSKTEVNALVALLTGSERMAGIIAGDYAETFQQFAGEGVSIDGDRWLVLTLISYGYDVDRLKPTAPAAAATRGTVKTPTVAEMREALLRVPFPERFCFLLRYLLAWDLPRIARLMLCDVPRVELAIGAALYKIREQLLSKTESPTHAQV